MSGSPDEFHQVFRRPRHQMDCVRSRRSHNLDEYVSQDQTSNSLAKRLPALDLLPFKCRESIAIPSFPELEKIDDIYSELGYAVITVVTCSMSTYTTRLTHSVEYIPPLSSCAHPPPIS